MFQITQNTKIQVETEKTKPIEHGLAMFLRDQQRCLCPTELPENNIRLLLDSSLAVEQYRICATSSKEMTIFASDDLGFIYALLYLSKECLGVLPFWFWLDQEIEPKETASLLLGEYSSPKYTIRYRGWFVNDEVLIDRWNMGTASKEKWEMVFEALLRCGGNMTIPGTDKNSRANRRIAANMGLWITHHHAEPLGADLFYHRYPDKEPSYAVNAPLFLEIWEDAIQQQKKDKIIWNLAFRGQGDSPFWANDHRYATDKERGRLISDIIKIQYDLVRKHVKNPLCCTNLYGEIMELYQGGFLELPEDVIKIWADNGYGKMVSRRQGNHDPRISALPQENEKGPHGIYYHCSFHDLQASNHLTLLPNSMDFVADELRQVCEAGAQEYWIVNCGSLKPHTYPLAAVAAVWEKGEVSVEEHRQSYGQQYYSKQGEKAAEILRDFPETTLLYGAHKDNRAGEQLYHHPVREMLHQWMKRDFNSPQNSVIWLLGEEPLPRQIEAFHSMLLPAVSPWEALAAKCQSIGEELSQSAESIEQKNQSFLWYHSLTLPILLQTYGVAGATAFCESFFHYQEGNIARSFLKAHNAYRWYQKSYHALQTAEKGKWKGFYLGDCLTDIRMTMQMMEGLVSYLRIIGDGPFCHRWEREYLLSAEEKAVMLLSCKQRAMDNHELYQALTSVLLETENL